LAKLDCSAGWLVRLAIIAVELDRRLAGLLGIKQKLKKDVDSVDRN
jgi:hypothetical protein